MKLFLNQKFKSDELNLTPEQLILVKKFQNLIFDASQIVLDKKSEIEIFLVGILSRGHILIEDVPGVGKTTLVQTLAKFLGLDFHRIQFTNDLLPADILGNTIFNPQTSEFSFHFGPLFAELVLGDELNRANPKTQSALLEALEEGQVTYDAKVYQLPKPFFFVATQNPRQQVGTFALPESQLDRFLISLDLNYATREGEIRIFMGYDSRSQISKIQPAVSKIDLLKAQEEVQKVYVSEKVAEYIYLLTQTSRQSQQKFAVLSTRAGLALVRASQAYAFLQTRGFVLPEDVQKIAPYVLGHRLGLQDGIKHGQEKCAELISATKLNL